MSELTTLEQRAIDFAKRGDFGTDALRANEELTRLAPANHGAWTRLARCCLEMSLLDEASAALDRALELNPQNTIARSLQGEVARRRTGPPPAALKGHATRDKSRAAARTTKRARVEKGSSPAGSRSPALRLPAFGRAEFAALGHLTPQAAVDALGGGVEALLVALNERPFAEKVVEARNRAGQAGNWLFRRNTVRAGRAGHIYAFHHGGRWEPQMNVGFFAASHWQRDAVRAGIGFNFSPDSGDGSSETGQERALEYFDEFQRLVSTRWRQLLTAWMEANGGFIQYADGPPETSLLPNAAVEKVIDVRHPAEVRFVFCGRWLFLDRAEDAETLSDGGRLVRWMEQAFTDLLPLWMDVYRGA